MVSVRISWSIGLLATLALLLPASAGAFPLTLAGDEVQPLEPIPLVTNTLPGPLGVGDTLFYDIFDWCDEYPCQLLDGPPMSTKLSHANGGTSVVGSAWQVAAGGTEGTGALEYISKQPGRSYGVRVQPDNPFASPGRTLSVSFAATGPAYTTLHDGGLRLEINTRHLGVETGWQDCWAVPTTPTGNGHSEFVPLNPACKAIPATTEVMLRFTVEEGIAGGVPQNVAIDYVQLYRAL